MLSRNLLLALLGASGLSAAYQLESNVVYGMYSGLALLMDVYHPAQPNGYGIIQIAGSGWHSPQELSAPPLKESGQAKLYAARLAEAGYTVFAISHRAAPRFKYPAAVQDAQRAVRFVRHNAARFGIRGDRIGASGGSSGGHLVSLLGVLDVKGDPQSSDPVQRHSAKVQCVVARAAPADMILMGNSARGATVASFMGMQGPRGKEEGTIEAKLYREASPLFQVTPDDAPFLLMHGDADDTVPFQHSEMMEKALRQAGVAVKLLRVPNGGHGAEFPGASNPPDYMGAMISWFDEHLKAPPVRAGFLFSPTGGGAQGDACGLCRFLNVTRI